MQDPTNIEIEQEINYGANVIQNLIIFQKFNTFYIHPQSNLTLLVNYVNT